METWQEVLRKNSIASLEVLSVRFGAENFPELDRLKLAADNFEFRISPAMADLIKSPGDPSGGNMSPASRSSRSVDGIVDSLNEDADSPVPNITHRYPDRALFLVSPVCASIAGSAPAGARWATPRRSRCRSSSPRFSTSSSTPRSATSSCPGGDPLLLNDRRLEAILTRLRAIPHLQIIRIGTRIPCHLPERITPELCAMLKRFHPLFINTHFNHPDELTPAAVAGLGRLADAGIPLGCQTVLLKGVNDDPEVMKQLMQRLLMARVRPYYIYMADQVAGAEHFRTTVQTGIRIMEALRGWTSGLANPHFVIDAPGGGGKIPLLPEYVISMTDEEVVVRNFRGDRYVYRQPREAEVIEIAKPRKRAGKRKTA